MKSYLLLFIYFIILYLFNSCKNENIHLHVTALEPNIVNEREEDNFQELPELWVFISVENNTPNLYEMQIPRFYSKSENIESKVLLHFENDSIQLFARHDPSLFKVNSHSLDSMILITNYQELEIKKSLYGTESYYQLLKFIKESSTYLEYLPSTTSSFQSEPIRTQIAQVSDL